MDNMQQGNGRDLREVVTQQTYDRVAAKYGHTRCGKGTWQAELEVLWQFLEKQGKGKKRLLDLGCGTGRVLQHALQSKMLLKQYVGVDYSLPMLEEALLWNVKTGVPFVCSRHADLHFLESFQYKFQHVFHKPSLEVHLVEQRMQDIDPPTSYFDGISMVASFHHLLTREDQETVLELCFHTLKPGGVLFMTNWRPEEKMTENPRPVSFKEGNVSSNRYYYIFTAQELKELLLYAGFTIVHCEEASAKQPNIVIVAEKQKL